MKRMIRVSRMVLNQRTASRSFNLVSGCATKRFFSSQTNHSDESSSLLISSISNSIKIQDYSSGKRALRPLTKNWLGFYKGGDNQLALYLQSLILLETSGKYSRNILSPLLLSSDKGLKDSHLLLATLSYLKLNSSLPEDQYLSFLRLYNDTLDWTNEKLVHSTLETYLKDLAQKFDSKFSHLALGKLYMRKQEYNKALSHLTIAMDKDFDKARLELAILLRNGSTDGKISKNPDKALEIIRTMREYNDEGAKIQMEMHRNGEVTNASKLRYVLLVISHYAVKILSSFKIVIALFLISEVIPFLY